jgi:thioredoxin 1
MSWAGYLVLSLVGLSLALVLWSGLSARHLKGQPVDVLYSALPALRDCAGKAVVYCHSEHCAPCRKMMPEIERLRRQHANLFALDISRHASAARSLGIRATPTHLLVENGIVIKALLGSATIPAITVFLAQH